MIPCSSILMNGLSWSHLSRFTTSAVTQWQPRGLESAPLRSWGGSCIYIISHYLHIYIYIILDIYVYIYIYILDMYIYIYIKYICIYTYKYIYTYIHTCMHACMHTYIHTYIYIYIYTSPINENVYSEHETGGQAKSLKLRGHQIFLARNTSNSLNIGRVRKHPILTNGFFACHKVIRRSAAGKECWPKSSLKLCPQ